MRKHLIRRAACAIAAAGMLSTLIFVSGLRSTYASSVPKKLAVLFTNDTLGNLEPCG